MAFTLDEKPDFYIVKFLASPEIAKEMVKSSVYSFSRFGLYMVLNEVKIAQEGLESFAKANNLDIAELNKMTKDPSAITDSLVIRIANILGCQLSAFAKRKMAE